MALKTYLYCVIFIFLSLPVCGQHSALKSEYDSIIKLDILPYEKDGLIGYFFRKHEKKPGNEQELALCYHKYAIEIHDTDLERAIAYTKKAVAIREQYRETDPDALEKSLYNLGVFYDFLDDHINAISAYQQLVDVGQQDARTAKAHSRLGLSYAETGDFQKSIANFEKADEHFRANEDRLNLFRNHINKCYLYTLMEDVESLQKIRHHIRKADSLLTILNDAGSVVFPQSLLALSQAKGNLADDLGRYEEAFDHHKKSLEISLQIGDFYEISRSYNNLGLMSFELNKLKDAYIYYNNALAYAKDDPGNQAMVFDNLGDYYLDKEKFVKALEHYQKAINYASGQEGISYRDIPSLETLGLSPYKLDVLTYLTDKANAWMSYYEHSNDKGHLYKALNTLELADGLVDIIRFESTEGQSKLFWRERGADIYMNAVSACHTLNLPEKAFYFMEKNKALLLLEDLTHENAKKNARLPDALAAREFTLKQNIHWKEQDLIDAVAASITEKESLRNLIFDDKRVYEKFIDSLEIQYPDYYRYKRKLAVMTYDDVLETQQENAVMMHYIISEEKGYGLMLSGNKRRFFEIDSVSRLHENIHKLRSKLVAPFNTREELKDYQDLAYELYNSLFPGIDQEFLMGKTLCIIPDHDLQQFPFEVLITSPETPDAYLLNTAKINYAYSASFLNLNRLVKRNPSNYFIGFAPVEFTTVLDSLPMSDEEITQIAGMFPGDLFLQHRASKQNFIDNASDYKVIHLATHADVGEDTRPWIAFRNERLSLEELYATKNQAELVVLSACNTSQGELRAGEGLMSLARGFFSSGTQSVVATLWSADDQSTKTIMVDFYGQLKKGHTRSEALRYAKQQYLKGRSGSAASPYYWSSLILIGDAGSLEIPETANRNYYSVILGIGILLLLIIFWWTGRRYFRR